MRVKAANDEMARILKHGVTGVGFVDINTSADWPEDTFTQRRIRDGDIVIDETRSAEPAEVKTKEERKIGTE